ncbi:thiamine pyrophosphate-binding protein [Rhodococcus sp. NPDC057014]|uniref:thiamine pyrophosphate-binding protein n=1 Tax=Rhodococcus sp. NPDC057014 TaxID=3346000 RepID=UPI00362CB86E
MTETIDGATSVVRALSAANITTLFTLHGGHLDPIYHACLEHEIKIVDVRHEASAGHAAEAWARLSGGIGACVVTAGPGFTNVLTSMANAFLDGTPVLYLVGAAPLREAGLNLMQGGFDQLAMARPIAKHVVQVTDPARIDDQIATAITVALSGRPGPVVVELPLDVLVRPCPRQAGGRRPVRVAPSVPNTEVIREVVDILESAVKPVLILGDVARYQATPDQVASFLAATGIPAVSDMQALGLADPAAPGYAHLLDTLAIASATGTGAADAALVLGQRLGGGLGGRSGAFLPADCRVIHVHPEALELSALRQPEVAVSSDCGAFLDAITEAWKSTPEHHAAWRDSLTQVPTSRDTMLTAEVANNGIHPFHAAQEVIKHSPADAVYVLDGAEALIFTSSVVRTTTPGGVLASGQFAGLGTGMGMALGAATIMPNRPIVHILGDGAMGFHIQEFDTLRRHNLPVVTVILNNDIWGVSLHGQQGFYGEDYSCITRIPGVAYADAAQGFGCHAENVDRLEDIEPALKRAFASGRPSCINVSTSSEVVPAAIAALFGPAGDGEIAVPYYENIPTL